jgi:hypothetical protein
MEMCKSRRTSVVDADRWGPPAIHILRKWTERAVCSSTDSWRLCSYYCDICCSSLVLCCGAATTIWPYSLGTNGLQLNKTAARDHVMTSVHRGPQFVKEAAASQTCSCRRTCVCSAFILHMYISWFGHFTTVTNTDEAENGKARCAVANVLRAAALCLSQRLGAFSGWGRRSRPSGMKGKCEGIGWAVADRQQGVILQFGRWAVAKCTA